MNKNHQKDQNFHKYFSTGESCIRNDRRKESHQGKYVHNLHSEYFAEEYIFTVFLHVFSHLVRCSHRL